MGNYLNAEVLPRYPMALSLVEVEQVVGGIDRTTLRVENPHLRQRLRSFPQPVQAVVGRLAQHGFGLYALPDSPVVPAWYLLGFTHRPAMPDSANTVNALVDPAYRRTLEGLCDLMGKPFSGDPSVALLGADGHVATEDLPLGHRYDQGSFGDDPLGQQYATLIQQIPHSGNHTAVIDQAFAALAQRKDFVVLREQRQLYARIAHEEIAPHASTVHASGKYSGMKVYLMGELIVPPAVACLRAAGLPVVAMVQR